MCYDSSVMNAHGFRIEIIPAYDCILDQPPAYLGDFLILFLALDELMAVAERNGLRELV